MAHLEHPDPGAARRRSITIVVRTALGVGLIAFLALSLLPGG